MENKENLLELADYSSYITEKYLPSDRFLLFKNMIQPDHRFEMIHFGGDRPFYSFRIRPADTQSPEQAITECMQYIAETCGNIVSQSIQDLPGSEIRITVTVDPPNKHTLINFGIKLPWKN